MPKIRRTHPPNSHSPHKDGVTPLLRGRVVDLSQAHDYYRKLWGCVRPRIDAEVTDWGLYSYKLSPRFYQHFSHHLSQLRTVYVLGPNFNVGDSVAFALRQAGLDFGIPKGFANRTHSRQVKKRPSGHSRLTMADSERIFRITLAVPESGEELLQSRGSQIQKDAELMMEVRFTPNADGLPKIAIQIEGEPVRLFWQVLANRDGNASIVDVPGKVVQRWRSLLKWLSLLTGFERPTAGRPGDDLFEQAALLHHLHGLSIPKVSKKLCPRNHEHGKACAERFRKGIERFWKRQRETALALPPPRS